MRRPITVQINNYKSNVLVALSAGRASNDDPEGALFAQPNDTDNDGRGGTLDPLEMRFLVKRLIWLQWLTEITSDLKIPGLALTIVHLNRGEL
ncbi:hypothetical protein CDAR_385641 [Caerostris darwini]|uniref:Uncharacterized protein n=1 Tax=Caerostris darwini TaxID=1538125 RepID=A0AAV4M6T5_9ARAC|nr:hypothetical protein CDAR_385641 [Caerostris darwini]